MPIKVKVINPDKILFEGTADYVLAPSPHGTLGLMPGHTPMFAELVKGDLVIKGQKEEIMAVETGILKIRDDELTVLISPA